MSRQASNDGPSAVSSTPFPKRTNVGKLLKTVFENQSLSPIPAAATSTSNELKDSFPSVLRTFKPAASSTLNPVKPQTRRYAPKRKESAACKALKELKLSRENNLCHSRNLYNMHPEPVIVDSDEEEMTNQITNNEVSVKNEASKKTQGNKKQKLNPKADLDQVSVDKTEKPKITKPVLRKKPSPKTTSTVTKSSRKVLESVNNIQKNAKPSSVNPKIETKPKPYQFDQLDSLFNLDSLDDEEDCNDDEPKVRKSNNPLNENTIDKDNVNDAASTSKVNENLSNISSFAEVYNGKEKTFVRQLNGRKVVQEAETLKSTKFPRDCVSHFKDVIFKNNRKCGGIVAQTLNTENADFGYVEITKDQTFLGACPKVTFVMIQGEVILSQGQKKETLIPGDMLHILQEEEYQITNQCNQNARLMYIKERGK